MDNNDEVNENKKEENIEDKLKNKDNEENNIIKNDNEQYKSQK